MINSRESAFMDINQLKYFISVSQLLSFTEAAKKHFITQPAISHQINNLESELGVKLLTRTSHSVKLTKAGREFYPYAIATLENLQSAQLRMKSLAEGYTGYLKISGVISSSNILSKCVAAFSKQYPDVQLSITLTSPHEEQKHSYDEYDFNFVAQDMLPAGDNFDYTLTERDRLSLVVDNDHPLLKQGLTDFSVLKDEPFITVSEINAPVLYNEIMTI